MKMKVKVKIIDISHYWWENKNIEISDFEDNHGSITFYAKQVIDLDEKNI